MQGRELKWSTLLEKERGYLFGMFEGDGYKIHDKRSRHYQVEFYLNSLKDKKIIRFIVELLKKINLNPNTYQDKRYHCKRIRVYSKELFKIINKNINLLEKSNDFIMGYISGLIDSEGYVNNFKSYILIINTNKKILKNCKDSLSKLKISSRINKRVLNVKDKKSSYRMYISVNFKRLNHLSIKAGKPR
ncbi:MAG: hypothetical protein KKF68_00640 [Nanoarchaeota archaeon]|nr:hypothetical protein [Nanoarchaeota archaeon]